ncbi:hypothetical protein [Clostridioides difficile]
MEINYSDEELKKLKEGYLKQKQSLPLEAKIILTKKGLGNGMTATRVMFILVLVVVRIVLFS